ncbi:VOC family protein [Indioceanicola profundi]|uniref:VOC family protein n=1 Tax=Indioceanicola profundi TaxID=2220096 RepID=UPI000E6AA48A|nr:VOC family protein [Indioceanicola profundi]
MAVTGIGGFFFRARDPQALAEWYLTHLGVGAPEGAFVWPQQAGPTVFQPFSEDSAYFPADRGWMLNLRVDDLDSMLADLSAAGIAITRNPDWDSPQVGRFARLYDPEGNPVELWEPTAVSDPARRTAAASD